MTLTGTLALEYGTTNGDNSFMTRTDWDVIVVGSGFGGSVSALRLVEKGYSVLVIEKWKSHTNF